MDEYQLGQIIGKGSYGVVRKAQRRTSREFVAIKCIEKKRLCTAEEVAIPQREIQALRSLPRHPNSVFLEDAFEDASSVFLVFELVQRGTLAQWISRQPLGLPEPDAKSVARQLAAALDHIHSHGLVHVDVTPRNVLVDEGGVVKLCDFGFAVVNTGLHLGMRGSINYASPELVRGETFDESTDVWSLGVLCYETITGVSPFTGGECAYASEVAFPDSLWNVKSKPAVSFTSFLLTMDASARPCIKQVQQHEWLHASPVSSAIALSPAPVA
jgi:serine/threonine protein kinase